MSGEVDALMATLERRNNILVRLLKSLEHLSHVEQMSIVTSYIGLDSLEDITVFQENRS